ncbi:MAG: hypothetical protein AAB320_06135 [Elusimicrobiota bacterium]
MAMRAAEVQVGAATNEEDKYDAKVRAFAHEKKMMDFFSDAIGLTERYYHLTPPQPNGSVVKPKDPLGRGEWSAGLGATWKPEFLYAGKETLKVPGKDGRNHFIGDKISLSATGGGTYPNGRTIILREIFEDAKKAGNPGPLAFLIHHEGRHFSELIGRGRDNYEEGELRAYKASLEAADTFELDDDNKEALIGKKIKEHSKALRSGRRSSTFPSPEEEMQNELALEAAERGRAKFNADFEGLRSRVETARKARRDADALRRLAEAEAAAAAAELRLKQEQLSRQERLQEEEKRNKAWEKTYEIRWEIMKALTKDACKDAPAFRNYYRNTLSPETRMPEQLLLQKLRQAKDDHSLNACQQEVIAFFVQSDGPAMLSDLADLAWKSTSLGDPLAAVTGFFRSILDKLNSPSGPGRPGFGRSDPEERRGGGDHGGSAPGNPNGPAYGQLKGIAGGSSWPR